MFLLQQNKVMIGELIQKYSDCETEEDRQVVTAAWRSLNTLLGNERTPYSQSIIQTFIDPHTVYASHQFTMKRKNRNVSVWATSAYHDSVADPTEVASEEPFNIKRTKSAKPKDSNDYIIKRLTDSPRKSSLP